VFPACLAVYVPCLNEFGSRAKVIDMPMGTAGNPRVVSEPCPEASGAKRAPHVEVVAGLELMSPQSSDRDASQAGQVQEDDVGTRTLGERFGLISLW
jgi:hypothetical protein